MILAGKKSSTESDTEKRADYEIFKDIDITEQLQRALEKVLHRPVSST